MDTPITDDYVISLLQKEAQPSKLGSAFPASKRDRNAPKPNTRFLRNLVRDADSHNSALLAKEKAETRARLRGLEREGEKRSRDETTNDEEGGVKRRREDEREEKGERRIEGDQKGATETWAKAHARKTANETRIAHHHAENIDRTENAHQTTTRDQDRLVKAVGESADARTARKQPIDIQTTTGADAHIHAIAMSDSDPLDSLIGPAPPPISRPRGRGANNTTNRTTIDLRFNDPSYNPRADVAHSDSEGEGEKDQWATSLEALRDRAAWREKGAQRLREAGFGDRDVEKWEGSGREKDERDLRWRARGEGREWDAGKVAGEEGEVRVKAAWTQGL
ncbi:hypothetical protein Q7P37_006183 [Cladosporium fusiforme]